MTTRPSIFGRDRYLVEQLTKLIHGTVKKQHSCTVIEETKRGETFRLRILDADDKPTGHVVRVTIELEGVEQVATETV